MLGLNTPENLQGISLGTKRGGALKRYRALENYRSSWRNQWIELSDYLLPRRGRYLLEHPQSRGRRRNTKILDNSPGQALRTLSAGMMSGMTSPVRPWFRFQLERGDDREGKPGVKEWLGMAEVAARSLLGRSNFYNSMAQIYTELGAFGTAPLLRRKHPQRYMHFRPYTAGEYVIAEDEYGDVDTLGREVYMTVSQIVERFVWDDLNRKLMWGVVSSTVKQLWDNGTYDQDIPVVHMIHPRRREERDLRRLDGAHRPYADLYFELGGDNEKLLKEDGYFTKPFYVPRWDVMGGDVYGYSPGMEHLGDIKQLQHQQRRKAQAIDKMVNPPMRAHASLKGRPTTVLPGGTTYVDPVNGQPGFEPVYQVQPRIQEMMMDINEVQERIQRGFFADLFAMMINSDRRQITATEVAERHEEKLVLLGPVLQRLNTELLDPLVEDALMTVIEQELVPPIPEALQGADIDIKYVSLLMQAQEAAAASSIERTLGFAGNMAAVNPEIMDNIDADVAFREYAQILGNKPGVIRDMNEVKEIRQARAQAQQAEQQAMQAETMRTGADAARLLSETDTQTPNALTALLRTGETVA